MSKKSQKHAPKKFMFNMNNFDDGAYPEIENEPENELEELPPLPPVFTEDEVEIMTAKAYKNGKQDGIDETKAARSQSVAEVLDLIGEELPKLFDHQEHHKSQLKADLGTIMMAIFDHVFPVLRNHVGPEALKDYIAQAVDQNSTKKAIIVTLHPETKPGVEAFLQKISAQYPHVSLSVDSDDAIPPDGCRLSWDGGGGSYNPDHIGKEIASVLTQALADDGAAGHDEDEPLVEHSDE